MDRLIEAIDNTQNPSVVGLDPTEALVPPQVVASFADEVRDSVESPEEVESAQLAVAYFEYNRTIIDAIADIVPAVKPQIAMYTRPSRASTCSATSSVATSAPPQPPTPTT